MAKESEVLDKTHIVPIWIPLTDKEIQRFKENVFPRSAMGKIKEHVRRVVTW